MIREALDQFARDLRRLVWLSALALVVWIILFVKVFFFINQ
jgi:hypothetical protein